MSYEANATTTAEITGMCSRVFRAGERVHASPQDATDRRRGWVTLHGAGRGYPTVVCVPIGKVKLDVLVGPTPAPGRASRATK